MKKVDFGTFSDWIDEVFPEIVISGPNKDSYELVLASLEGPIVTEAGIETEEDDLPWDYNAKEIEWKAQDLLEGKDSDEIDFMEEAEALLEVAKRVRNKLKLAGKQNAGIPEDYIHTTSPSGRSCILVPFLEKYIDTINDVIFDYFNAIMEDDSEEPRKTYRKFLEE